MTILRTFLLSVLLSLFRDWQRFLFHCPPIRGTHGLSIPEAAAAAQTWESKERNEKHLPHTGTTFPASPQSKGFGFVWPFPFLSLLNSSGFNSLWIWGVSIPAFGNHTCNAQGWSHFFFSSLSRFCHLQPTRGLDEHPSTARCC